MRQFLSNSNFTRPLLGSAAALLVCAVASWAQGQQPPLVYAVENTGAAFPAPVLPDFAHTPIVRPLPDPFVFANGTRDTSWTAFEQHRNEWKHAIEQNEIGTKPDCHDCTVTASYVQTSVTAGTLTINVTRNAKTLTFTSAIVLPAPSATCTLPAAGWPYVIGMGSATGSWPASAFNASLAAPSGVTVRPAGCAATVVYSLNSVTRYTGGGNAGSASGSHVTDPFYTLYPEYCAGYCNAANGYPNGSNHGQYAAWTWGVSRLIDAIQIKAAASTNPLPLDTGHSAATGCSYAGKMAMWSGALDERIALTIAQDRVEAASQPQQAENQYGPSFAFLAWDLFLKAMTPSSGSLTFETWTEQCQLSPDMVGCPSAAKLGASMGTPGFTRVRLLHGSALSRAKKMEGSDCGAMTMTPIGGYAPPANLTQNAMFCEEVFVSPVEESFVKRSLTTLISQQTYGKDRNGSINFPGTETNDTRLELDSVEVKVDWVPASSFSSPTFACPDPTNSLYTETIHGTCYALAAVHISSKTMPKWMWATFEPDSIVTNPNRCDQRLYGTCFDPWGTTSRAAYGKGQTVQQSPELRQAMDAAHLSPALHNYFLTGVQTEFVDNDGKPTQLGNSFVEFNQGVPPGKSSCITCHQYASFDGRQPAGRAPEHNFGRPPHGWPSIGYACDQNQNGNCLPTTAESTTQDFFGCWA